MATRTLEIDLRQGTGASSEPMYGVVTVQRAKAKSAGGFEILPFEATLKLVNGKATITEAETDGAGPIYDSVYLFRVQNGYCAPRWGFMAALPDGSTPITTGELPMVDPITGEGIYMDAQEWNELYGDLPDRVTSLENSQTVQDQRLDDLEVLGGLAPGDVSDATVASLIVNPESETSGALSTTITKASVGLSNVDNTSDADKPVSTAQSSAITAYGKLSNSSKLVTDAPTSYTTAFSTMLGRVSDGWPQLGSSGNYTQVTTMRSGNNYGGVLQVLSAHDDTSTPLQYRVSNGGNYWGAFRELVSSDALREAEAFVNVKSFGAVGDGVTDDRAAIQAAIDATVSTSQGVYVPSGTWRIGAPLRSPQGNLHLRLHPNAEIRKHGSNAMFVNGVQKSTVAGGNNIIIEGGVWNCRGIANGTDGSIFALGLGENIVIRNLTAKNVNLSHIAEIAACTNVLFENIKFGGFGSSLVKEAFQIERMSSTGFPYFNLNTGEHCKNIRLVRCTQISPDSGYNRWPVAVGNHANQAVQGADGVRIQDCDFGVCSDAVLYLDHFTNVSIDGVTGQGGAVTVFQSDKARKNNYTVNNLHITNSSGNGVVLRNLINVNITNSEFSGAYGVWITGCEDVVLENVGAYATDWDAVIVQQATGYTNPQKNISLTDLKVSGNHGVAIAGEAEVDGVTITRLRTVTRLGGMGVSVGGSAKNVSVRDSYFLTPIGATATIRIQNSSKVIAVGNRYTSGTPLTNATSQLVESSNTTLE